MCAHCPQDCSFTFIAVVERSWVCVFFYFMNNRVQTDLPLKMIHVSLIHVTKCNTTDNSLFCLKFRIDLFEKMVNLRLSFFEVFYFKYSSSVISENSHALLKNIVLIYSKIFFNSKF